MATTGMMTRTSDLHKQLIQTFGAKWFSYPDVKQKVGARAALRFYDLFQTHPRLFERRGERGNRAKKGFEYRLLSTETAGVSIVAPPSSSQTSSSLPTSSASSTSNILKAAKRQLIQKLNPILDELVRDVGTDVHHCPPTVVWRHADRIRNAIRDWGECESPATRSRRSDSFITRPLNGKTHV